MTVQVEKYDFFVFQDALTTVSSYFSFGRNQTQKNRFIQEIRKMLEL